MHISDISFIGWIHTTGCIVALIFGAWNIIAVKGTPLHKRRGQIYAASMVMAMGLSFFLYRFDIPLVRGERPGPHVFGLFHVLSVATLVFTALGYYAASRQSRGFWAYAHPVCMTLSYSLLLGGLVNELFARLDILLPFAFSVVHGKRVFPGPAVSLTQFGVDVVTVILLILFCVQVGRYRRGRASVRRSTSS